MWVAMCICVWFCSMCNEERRLYGALDRLQRKKRISEEERREEERKVWETETSRSTRVYEGKWLTIIFKMKRRIFI